MIGRYAFTEKSKKALGNKQINKFISIFQVTQLLNSAYRLGEELHIKSFELGVHIDIYLTIRLIGFKMV